MRSAFDFSSWQALVSTLLGLVLVSLIAVGVRLLVMHTVQEHREPENRQINERLKTLIAADGGGGGTGRGAEHAADDHHDKEMPH
jgi:glucose uptake protein GlcU